jgi:hypothetical protein
MTWPGNRQSVEEALERNLLASKIISLYPMEASFSAARTLGHNLQITAILKLSKPAVCSLPRLAKGGVGGFESYFPGNLRFGRQREWKKG